MERLGGTTVFLPTATIELRRLADKLPEIADELHSIARQLRAETDDPASRAPF